MTFVDIDDIMFDDSLEFRAHRSKCKITIEPCPLELEARLFKKQNKVPNILLMHRSRFLQFFKEVNQEPLCFLFSFKMIYLASNSYSY